MAAVPWHMWGSTEVITQSTTSPGLRLIEGRQLTQIKYGRPITWGFFLAARLLAYENHSPAPVIVDFNLTFGLGRSTIAVPQFERFQFDGLTLNEQKYSASVLGPERVDGVTGSRSTIDKLVAQDIQIQAVASMVSTVSGDGFTVEVDSYFAPIDHIRPEWFVHHFPGHETEGR